MLERLFRLAVKHVATNPAREDSARHCLASARLMELVQNEEAARQWLLKSLKHSIGILHPDYPAETSGNP